MIQTSLHKSEKAQIQDTLAKTTLVCNSTILLQALLASAVVVSLYGIYQYHFELHDISESISSNHLFSKISALPEQVRMGILGRVATKRSFSTFAVPNSLAAFLVLLLLVQAGYIMELLNRKDRPKLTIAIYVGFWSVMLLCLLYTFSKGGWIAIFLGLAIFAFFVGRKRLQKHKRLQFRLIIIFLFACIFLLAAGYIIGVQEMPAPYRFVASMTARMEYWDGALKMIKDHFWTGVGLNNFGDYYPLYKAADADESRMVHNDFLQIWAEVGIIGFLSFCFMWIFWLKNSLMMVTRYPEESSTEVVSDPDSIVEGKDDCPSRRNRRHARKKVAKGNVTEGKNRESELNLSSYQEIFISFSLLILLCVSSLFLTRTSLVSPDRSQLTLKELIVRSVCLWLLWYMTFKVITYINPFRISSRDSLSYNIPKLVRQGIIAGIIAVLIHSLGDFDFYVHGVAQSIWLLAAISLTWEEEKGEERREWENETSVKRHFLPPRRQWLINARVSPKVGNLFIATGVMLICLIAISVSLILIPASLHRGKAMRYFRAGYFSKSIVELKKGIKANPWDDDMWAGLGRSLEESWKNNSQDETKFYNAINAYENAISLRPSLASYHFQLAKLFEAGAKKEMNPTLLAKAAKKYKDAVRWYPTKPFYRFRLGEIYEKEGKRREALAEYRRALNLHDYIAKRKGPATLLLPDDVAGKLRERIKNGK